MWGGWAGHWSQCGHRAADSAAAVEGLACMSRVLEETLLLSLLRLLRIWGYLGTALPWKCFPAFWGMAFS